MMMSNQIKYFVCLLMTSVTLITAVRAEQTVILLETSDLHGFIWNWDYFGNREFDQGLIKAAALIKQIRQKHEAVLLLDGGDTIQGSPLIYYYNVMKPDEACPMAVCMNALEYDAMTIGNHEYNFGQPVLDKFIDEAEFPVMSANILHKGQFKYQPYFIKKIKGITIGVLGLTTIGIPVWENPDHISGLEFRDPIAAAQDLIPELQALGATVLVALVHAGPHLEPENPWDDGAWETDYRTWVDKGYAHVPEQNFMITLAEACPELDVIMGGHAHSLIPDARVNGVLLTEPYAYGRGISKVTLTVDDSGRVIDKHGEFLSVKEVAPDPELEQISKVYHDTALEYVRSPLGFASSAFPGGNQARLKDGPLTDFINEVQFDIARNAGYPADVSLAAVFNDRGRLNAGTITVADVYGIYQYENTLVVMEISGSQLRAALEHDAGYWKQLDGETDAVHTADELKSGDVRDYNWDIYSGIDYTIDLRLPEGERVTELRFNQKPVRPNQKLILAVNSYRAGGGGGYTMFQEGRILWQSMTEIRDYMVNYIAEKDTLRPGDYYQLNWKLEPEYLIDKVK